MTPENIKNLINESRRKQDTKSVALLTFLLGEYELQSSKNANVAMDQIIHKAIESNQVCLAARYDEKLVDEVAFFSSLLPNYLSVAELNEYIKPLELDNTGKAMGSAIKYLKANGLSFRNEDLKKALDTPN
jgi:hypothetical protein